MEKSNPKISVVIPVYNGEKFLADTIQSVLNQTFKDFELIIINDGSTDKTEEIIKNFMKRDKRIVFLKNLKNKGLKNLHNVTNKGYKKARGKYIAHLDSDDIFYPNKLSIQYNYLEKHKDIFLVGCSADLIDIKGGKIGKIKKRFWHRFPIILKIRIAFSNSFVHPSIMFRNEGFLIPLPPDHFFYYNLMFNKKKLINLPQVLVKYRINPWGGTSWISKNKFKLWYEDG